MKDAVSGPFLCIHKLKMNFSGKYVTTNLEIKCQYFYITPETTSITILIRISHFLSQLLRHLIKAVYSNSNWLHDEALYGNDGVK